MPSIADHEFKIILLGESGVGKTSLSHTYTTGRFNPKHPSTVVADRTSKELTVKGKRVKLCIWETSNKKWLNNVAPNYYDGVLLVYDTTDMMTFNALSDWLTRLREKSDGAVTLVVGNKIDQPDCIDVPHDVAEKFTRDEDLEFMETSAKKGVNVNNIFEYLTSKILLTKDLVDLEEVNCASSTNTMHDLNVENELGIEKLQSLNQGIQKHSLPYIQNSSNATHKKIKLNTECLATHEFKSNVSPTLRQRSTNQSNKHERVLEQHHEPIPEIRRNPQESTINTSSDNTKPKANPSNQSNFQAQTLVTHESANCDALQGQLQESYPEIQKHPIESDRQNSANNSSHEIFKALQKAKQTTPCRENDGTNTSQRTPANRDGDDGINQSLGFVCYDSCLLLSFFFLNQNR